ncbi:hypothetical protein BRETT_002353 [Brettanomyces bruxellensis]|uniref:Histone H1 n=1 Tax=Dekkera bruxellensis TaxID=5007 RepID=A0A871RIF3_DEKBR|nr:uncharacterized protein BRETT_002353 [Brettanomyces bruxellensis]QOU22181.1 hypothetical protein BRETT_002353 [Brettanomyces bruxellensis]
MATAKTAKTTYKDMIVSAVTGLKERNGSSRQALKKFIRANFDVNPTNFDSQFNMAIKRGVAAEYLLQPKGPSGPVKVNKTVIKPKKAVKKAPVKKEAKKEVKKETKKTKPAHKKIVKKAVAKKPAAHKKTSKRAPKKAVGTKKASTKKAKTTKKVSKKSSKKTKKAPKRK